MLLGGQYKQFFFLSAFAIEDGNPRDREQKKHAIRLSHRPFRDRP